MENSQRLKKPQASRLVIFYRIIRKYYRNWCAVLPKIFIVKRVADFYFYIFIYIYLCIYMHIYIYI